MTRSVRIPQVAGEAILCCEQGPALRSGCAWAWHKHQYSASLYFSHTQKTHLHKTADHGGRRKTNADLCTHDLAQGWSPLSSLRRKPHCHQHDNHHYHHHHDCSLFGSSCDDSNGKSSNKADSSSTKKLERCPWQVRSSDKGLWRQHPSSTAQPGCSTFLYAPFLFPLFVPTDPNGLAKNRGQGCWLFHQALARREREGDRGEGS